MVPRRSRLAFAAALAAFAGAAGGLVAAPLDPGRDGLPVRRAEPVAVPSPAATPVPAPAAAEPPMAPAVPFDFDRAPGAGEPPPAAAPSAPPAPAARPLDQMQLDVADALYARKMYDVAIPEYERYLTQYPHARGRQAALFRLAESHRQTGNIARAKSSYQLLVMSFADGEFVAPAAYRLADIYYEDGDFAPALSYFRKAEGRTPDAKLRLAARFYAARCLEGMKRSGEARAAYAALVETPGENPYRDAGRLALSKLLLDAGRNREAVEQMDLLSRDSQRPELRAEAKVRAALMRIDLDQFDRAAEGLKEALGMEGLGKWREVAQIGLLRVLYGQKKYREAADAFAAAEGSLSRESLPEALLVAANAHRQLGDHDRAGAMYGRIRDEFPKSPEAREAAFERLVSFYSAGAPELADEVDRFVKAEPNSARLDEARLLAAEAFFRKRDYAAAAARYERIELRKLPERLRPEALFKRGWSLAEAGEADKAVAAFTEFLEAHPNHALAPSALAQRALVRQRAGDFAGALADFSTVVERHPKARERELALQQKALIHGQQQDNERMVATFRQLLKEFPRTAAAAQANYWIGWAAFEAKDYQKAIAALDLARAGGGTEFAGRATLRIILSHFYLEQRAAAEKEAERYLALPKEQETGALPAEILRWLGSGALKEEKWAEAEQYLTLLSERESDYQPEDCLALGRAKLALGRFDESAKVLEAYLRKVSEPVPRATGLLELARAQLGLGEHEAARHSVEEALSLQPEGKLNAEGRLLDGDIATARGSVEDAAKIYLSVSVLFDDPAITPLALEKAYRAQVALGDSGQASKVLNTLQTRFPEYAQSKGLAR